MKLEIRLTQPQDPRFQALDRALDEHYLAQLGARSLRYRPMHVLGEGTLVCLLLVEGQAAACVALRPMEDGRGEVKRLFVLPQYRRQGLARQLMEVVETQALFQGYETLALETGREMGQALALYQGMGYQVVDPWPPFVGDEDTVCLTKELS